MHITYHISHIIKHYLDFNLDYNDDKKIREYFVNLLRNKKYAGKIDKSLEDIIEHFKYNKKLIVLEKNNYPKEVVDVVKNNCAVVIRGNCDELVANDERYVLARYKLGLDRIEYLNIIQKFLKTFTKLKF